MEAGPVAIATIIGTILGGIAGALKNRADHKRGIRAEDREDLTSQQDRYERILDRVTLRMEALEDDVRELREENDIIRREIRRWRDRYDSAIEYVRQLTKWIAQHVPTTAEAPPAPPAAITDDL